MPCQQPSLFPWKGTTQVDQLGVFGLNGKGYLAGIEDNSAKNIILNNVG